MTAAVTPQEDRADREAADWFARLNTVKISTQALYDFQEWRRSPENDAAFERIEALWDATGRLKGSAHAERLTAEALARASDRGRKPRAGPALLAGLALAATATLAVSFALTRGESFSTSIGEQRLVTLEDGTRLRLDTDSQVEVRMGRDRRDVTLLHGQAFFDVAHDPGRPFEVRAKDTRVRALGTRFDVRLVDDAVKVILVEGAVEVSESRADRNWRLKPGESLAPSAGPASMPRSVDVAAATSWTTGRLVFQATPLREAVAEVNRHSRRKVVVAAAELQDTPISGVFDVGDAQAFADGLSGLFALQVERGEHEIRLSPRA